MMKSMMDAKNDHEWVWLEYYNAFPYCVEKDVRKGCHPRKMIHENNPGKAIVLVHGLSDSSYYMADLAEHFHKVLGYDVYVPLLQCHGLKNPEGMTDVSLVAWKENVRFSIKKARERAEYVSIGGLSMGGALALYLGCTDHGVTGEVYLFSAALGLASGRFSFVGKLKEWLLRQPFVSILESNKSLIGANPYRYNRVSINSAVELAHLMAENNKLLLEMAKGRIIGKRFFSAWSESDDVVAPEALERLKTVMPETDYTSFIIPKEMQVNHACLVLKESVYAVGAELKDPPLEPANPIFHKMLEAITRHDSMSR